MPDPKSKTFKLIGDRNGILGLDIGTHSVKMVEWVEGVGIINFGFIELPLDVVLSTDEDKKRAATIDVLKKLMKTKKTSGDNVISVISGSQIAMRRMVIPHMPKTEIIEAVKWEMRNFTTFSVEKTVVDYQILGEISIKSVNKMEIAAVIANSDYVNEHLNLLKEVNITPISVIPVSLALGSLIAKTVQPLKEDITGVVNIGNLVTEINIFRWKSLHFTRSIPTAGASITKAMVGKFSSTMGKIEIDFDKAEKFKRGTDFLSESAAQQTHENIAPAQVMALVRPMLERLTNEIGRSMEYYRDDSRGAVVDRLILYGGGALLKNLDAFLHDGLRIKVEVGDPLKNLKISEDGIDVNKLRACAPLLAPAVGAVFSDSSMVNLLPYEIREKKKIIAKRIYIESGIAVLVCLLGFWYVMLSIKEGNLDKRITAAQVELNALSGKVENVKQLKKIRKEVIKKDSLINFLMQDELDWSGILQDITHRVPDNLILTNISLVDKLVVDIQEGEEELPKQGKKSAINIKGTISDNFKAEAILSDFMSALESSMYFTETALITIVEKDSATEDSVSEVTFEIICYVK